MEILNRATQRIKRQLTKDYENFSKAIARGDSDAATCIRRKMEEKEAILEVVLVHLEQLEHNSNSKKR